MEDKYKTYTTKVTHDIKNNIGCFMGLDSKGNKTTYHFVIKKVNK